MNPNEVRDIIRQSSKGLMLGPYTLPFASTLSDANVISAEFGTGGSFAYAGVLRSNPNGIEIGNFTGARFKLPKDAVLIDIFGYRGDVRIVVKALSSKLRTFKRPTLMRIFEEDKALKDAMRAEGWRYITTNVSAYAEVFGYYDLPTKSQFDVDHFNAFERYTLRQVTREPFITKAEQKAILKEADAYGVEWADHYSNYNKGHAWSAFTLRGYKRDDPGFIIKPSEMTAKWKKENPELVRLTRAYDTDAYRHFPTVKRLLTQRLPTGSNFDRIRLMRLTGGGELLRHCDISDKDAGIANGKVMRLHIPLVTSDNVAFFGINHRGRIELLTMQERYLYYLDQRKPHWVKNYELDLERIHLVIDVYATPALRNMFEKISE